MKPEVQKRKWRHKLIPKYSELSIKSHHSNKSHFLRKTTRFIATIDLVTSGSVYPDPSVTGVPCCFNVSTNVHSFPVQLSDPM